MLELIKPLIGPLIRHLLTALGASDLIDDSGINNLVSSLMIVAGILWSIFNAYRAKLATLPPLPKMDDVGRPLAMLIFLIVPLLFTGCAMQSAVSYNPETKETTRYNGFALFSNASLKGLNVGKKTKTTSNLFSLEEGNSEVNVEALRAMSEGAASGAVQGAVKGLKP